MVEGTLYYPSFTAKSTLKSMHFHPSPPLTKVPGTSKVQNIGTGTVPGQGKGQLWELFVGHGLVDSANMVMIDSSGIAKKIKSFFLES